MPEQCDPHMRPHCEGHMHVRNGRTYVRTTHLSSYLTLGNARRGADESRDWRDFAEIARALDAELAKSPNRADSRAWRLPKRGRPNCRPKDAERSFGSGEYHQTPFMGVGSEVYAAVQMGRHAIGAELKPSYFQQALRNLAAVDDELPAPEVTLFHDAEAAAG